MRYLFLIATPAAGQADVAFKLTLAMCLAAAGCAARQLQALELSDLTPLQDTDWLPLMQQLRRVTLGDQSKELRIASGITRLTAVQQMYLRGGPLVFECEALPMSLTFLDLADERSHAMPQQVSQESCCKV